MDGPGRWPGCLRTIPMAKPSESYGSRGSYVCQFAEINRSDLLAQFPDLRRVGVYVICDTAVAKVDIQLCDSLHALALCREASGNALSEVPRAFTGHARDTARRHCTTESQPQALNRICFLALQAQEHGDGKGANNDAGGDHQRDDHVLPTDVGEAE